jgi:hypothetical protein
VPRVARLPAAVQEDDGRVLGAAPPVTGDAKAVAALEPRLLDAQGSGPTARRASTRPSPENPLSDAGPSHVAVIPGGAGGP